MRGALRNLSVVVAAIWPAAALGACGGTDDEPAPNLSDDTRGILATVDALQTASRQGDARRICRELFTDALAKSIRDASKHTCEAEVRDTLTSPDARLSVGREVDVKGSRATATVREQNGKTSTVSFVKEGDGWHIERVTPVNPK
jgi:hypothetical protein